MAIHHQVKRLIVTQPQWSWGIASILILAIVIVGIKIIFFSHAGAIPTYVSAEAESGTLSGNATLVTNTSGASGSSYVLFTSAAPTPTPIPCGQAGGPCSAAQVATHNSGSNCWVIYGGNYYNVTSYVPNSHPGGSGVFNSTTCGHDITAYLNGSASTNGQQHGHSSSAYNILNNYKIGPVQ